MPSLPILVRFIILFLRELCNLHLCVCNIACTACAHTKKECKLEICSKKKKQCFCMVLVLSLHGWCNSSVFKHVVYIISWFIDFFVYDGHIFYIITKNGMTWEIENWETRNFVYAFFNWLIYVHSYLLYISKLFFPPSFPPLRNKKKICFTVLA